MQNTTPPKSNQDFFNRVYQYFVVEDKPRAYDSKNFRCKYRLSVPHKKSLGCAVGCVLPNKLAKMADETGDDDGFFGGSTEIGDVMTRHKPIKEWLKNVSPDLLKKAQKVHDDDFFELDKAKRLSELAESFKLSIPKG